MESWNHNFKVEAIHGERFLTRSDTKYQVFHNIEVYYNQNGGIPHWAMLVQKILKLKKSLSYVFVNPGKIKLIMLIERYKRADYMNW